jgi:putative serine protease PepD
VSWDPPTTILPGGQVPPQPFEPEPATPPKRRRSLPRPRIRGGAVVALVAAAALLLGVVASVDIRSLRSDVSSLRRDAASQRSTQARTQAKLNAAVGTIQGLQAAINKMSQNTIDASVSARVLKSVFTIEAGNSLGSAFAVRRSANGGTILVTNYHVVAGVWSSGARGITLKQGSRSISGQIDTVRPAKDLASVEVVTALPLLPLNVTLPAVGAPVLVVGSPLGLGGTVTTGVVSALRRGLIQISAPISPGNSGGPVVDAHGRTVGIASEKIVGGNAEGLGFAIPIREVCTALVRC